MDRAADVPASTAVIDHNLIDGFRGYEDEIYGEDFVEGDPQFANPAHYDFHLMWDSPAVDTGSALDAPVDDFDGDLRPQDGDGDATARTDIGADEWAAGDG